MAIQMRRGLKKDFDPSKMLPGEWAVSTDSDTKNQIIWMCFAPGIVKRMGTYEDFKSQIHEASAEIWEPYEETINEILTTMENLESSTRSYANSTESKANQAAIEASNASNYARISHDSAIESENSADSSAASASDSQKYSKESKSYAVGTEGEFRPGDDTDCAKHYYEQSKRILDSFADISAVAGVKGNAESAYRSGLVNITPDNVGAYSKEYIDTNSTSRARQFYLGSAGWYRVAKISDPALSNVQGSQNYSCVLSLKKVYNNGPPEYHKVQLASKYQSSSIIELCSIAHDGAKLITAVRHIVDGNEKVTYIEIYYNSEKSNQVFASLLDNYGGLRFELMNPEKTSDALASGVEKYSQCDLSANFDASYLLPKSGGKLTGPISFSGLDALQEDKNLKYFCGINAFANGGTLRWTAANDATVGNAASATKATQDGNGDNIANTYVKKGIYINDFNSTEACNPGFFIARSAKNAPENKQDDFSLLVMRTENGSGGPYAHQIAMQSATFNIYVRYVHDRMTFSEWKKVSLMSI